MPASLAAPLPLIAALPDEIGPYLTLMVAGFAVGAYGHLARSRLMVMIGIAMVFTSTLLLPLALNLFSDSPAPPPGPVAEP